MADSCTVSSNNDDSYYVFEGIKCIIFICEILLFICTLFQEHSLRSDERYKGREKLRMLFIVLQLLGIIRLLFNLLLFVLDYHVQILPDSINCNLSAFLFYCPMILFYGFHIFSIQEKELRQRTWWWFTVCYSFGYLRSFPRR